ncbi:MAG: hypothetical protein IPL86_05165 [Flavobacteriales bacterium]|nr:hypothetical protein [Flavobacteriales bacterium]
MLGTPALIRTLLVTLLLAAGTAVSAQRFQVKLGGKVTDYFSGDAMKGALVRVLKAGQADQQATTKGDGRYAFILERGWRYEVWFSKKDMITKHVIIDTREVPAYPDVPFYDMDLQMTLFPWIPEMDLSLFEDPLGMAAYKGNVRNMSWETPLSEQFRPVLAKLMDEYEKNYKGYYKRTGRSQQEIQH